ncbi:hypothetical protein [Pyrococcus kukulkanii]|uniref:hypothetical protein n=1 Tax=Pyrococcus kukulkanii TaxID=1609559 RepID=UPI003564823A
MFNNENDMKNIIRGWLENSGLKVKEGIYVKTFEIDIAAIGKKELTKNGFKSGKNPHVYAFETKIATTSKLVRHVVEQAIIRLLAVDYVYIVVPKEAEVWVNDMQKELQKPPELVKRYASGPYSKKVGLISVTPNGEINIVREAQKSGLVINELRDIVIKKLRS